MKYSVDTGRNTRCWIAVIIVVLLMLTCRNFVLGQISLSAAQMEQLASVPKGVPSDLISQVMAIGNRLRSPGKEETELVGQFLSEGGAPKTVRVVYQLSGMVRIEGLREKIPLLFDGGLVQGALERNDESLLETFVMDNIEGMVYSVRSGGALRLLGRGFGPDPRTVPDYKGPRYDIYEVTAPVRSRPDRTLRKKRYYFDSNTHFLVSTRYADTSSSPIVEVETRFSNWQQVEGSGYPGVIERYEAGRRTFSFVTTAASGYPRRGPEAFR